MENKNKKGIWRRLYKYVCEQCGMKRHTYVYQKFLDRECRKCKGKRVDENQRSMFEEIETKQN